MPHDLRRGKNNIVNSPHSYNMELTLGKLRLVLVPSCFYKSTVYWEYFLTVLLQLASLMLFAHERKCTCQVPLTFLNLHISAKTMTKTIIYHNCTVNKSKHYTRSFMCMCHLIWASTHGDKQYNINFTAKSAFIFRMDSKTFVLFTILY